MRTHSHGRRLTILAATAALLLPAARATAQTAAGRQRAGGGGAGAAGGNGPAALLRDTVKQLDLTDAQKPKVDGIVADLQKDVRGAMAEMRDATPEERRDKMKDVAAKVADARAKVEAELTAEQKVTFARKWSAALVDRAKANLKTAKAAAGATDLTDDEKAKFAAAAADAGKSLDGLDDAVKAAKTDADTDDVQKQVEQTQRTFRKAVVDAVGQEKAVRLMRQAVRQGGRRAAGGGEDAVTPATKPAK